MRYLIFILLASLLLGFNLSSNRFSEFYVEVKSDILRDNSKLIFTKEGLICSRNKRDEPKLVKFFYSDELNRKDVIQLQKYIMHENFINDSNFYDNSIGRVIDGITYTFVIRNDDSIKRILYQSCSNRRLDSLIFYINKIIPENYRKEFEVKVSTVEKLDSCKCFN